MWLDTLSLEMRVQMEPEGRGVQGAPLMYVKTVRI